MTKKQSQQIKELKKLIPAIRQKCLDCSAYSITEVKLCPVKECGIYPYRNGLKNFSDDFTQGNGQKLAQNTLLEAEDGI